MSANVSKCLFFSQLNLLFNGIFGWEERNGRKKVIEEENDGRDIGEKYNENKCLRLVNYLLELFYSFIYC